MKMGNWFGLFWISGIFLILLSGFVMGDIPPISVQNAHTSISADFFADKLSGSAPCVITFSDSSTGIIDHYEWSFGDGESSSDKNPVHIYTNPGVYTISLLISGTGGTDKKTRIGYIKISEPVDSPDKQEQEVITRPDTVVDPDIKTPDNIENDLPTVQNQDNLQTEGLTNITSVKAEFSVSNPVGLAPLEVMCNDSSIGNPDTWRWDFGDGSTSAAQSPIHIYQNPGIYTLSLTIGSTDGTDTIQKPDLITVIEPVSASFSAEVTEGKAPLKVQFYEQNKGVILKRLWNFGDGTNSNEENPIHVFENPGKYEVTLEVSGSHNEDTITRPSYIIVNPDIPISTPLPTPVPSSDNQPSVQIEETTENIQDTESVPEVLPAQQESQEIISETLPTESVIAIPIDCDLTITPENGKIPLDVTCTDLSKGDISAWLWDFGDGTTSAEQNPKHRYEEPGTFLINLTVYGPDAGNGVSKEKSIQVNPPSEVPLADFSVSSVEGTTPFSLVCTDMSSGEITDWKWDFGDGKVNRGKNPTHTYYDSGKYSITLTVKGPGGKNSITKDIIASPPPVPLNADFSCNNYEGNVPLKVKFNDASAGQINGWVWRFGDGEISAEQNPEHVYDEPGTYSVRLVISGDLGESEKLYENIIVVKENIVPVQAAFSALPIGGEAPLNVSFTDKSTGDITSRIWQFGDGESSDRKDPSHVYKQPGIYSVSLEVKGETGDDISVKDDLISVLGSSLSPELVIQAEPLEGEAPLSVLFKENSPDDIRSLIWDFGDGITSQEKSPDHVYQNPGIYDVRLTIQDGNGLNRSITKNQFVNVTKPVSPPKANFSLNVTEGTVPCTVQCTDLSEGEISDWKFEFEPGVIQNTRYPVYTYAAPGNYSIRLDVTGPGGSDTTSQMVYLSPLVPVEKPGSENVQSENQSERSGNIEEISNDLIIPFNFTPDIIFESDEITPELIEWVNESGFVEGNDTNSELVSSSETDVTVIVPLDSADNFSSPGYDYPKIIPSETFGTAPMTVAFKSSWSDKPGSFLWEFGDGTTDQCNETEHTYTDSGIYTIRLIYETGNGTREIIDNNLIEVVKPSPVPVASFTAESVSGVMPLNVSFISTSTGNITDWKWDFGDNQTGFGEFVSHTYEKAGGYCVGLSVSGPDGTSEITYNDLITVSSPNIRPKAEFGTDKRTGNAPLLVQFTDQSIGNISKTHWKFGDGAESYEKNPSHLFNATGIYTISLDIEWPDGSDSVTKRGYIVVNTKPDPLVARFAVNPTTGDIPLTIQCTSNSSGPIKRYLWEFGDGAVSEDKNPSHTYTKPGSYLLKLTIYGNAGMSSADQAVIAGPVLRLSGNIAHGSYSSRSSFH
ncbi:hypothetical protein DLD82_12970 [Methanospirillum stamsii]|uniref:PKD domain-containing protein n=2 Tax=Methanospirillum stamsii TaxID=1277351 RepID=A0A2V2N240_9EURY|nr:hypothetical protein DLD82_12970 [Methanospirillum stamsii]